MSKWKAEIKNNKTNEEKVLYGESKHELVKEVEDMNAALTTLTPESTSTGANAPWTIQRLKMQDVEDYSSFPGTPKEGKDYPKREK